MTSPSAPDGAAPSPPADTPTIDVSAMPRVLQRIVVMTLKIDPRGVVLAVLCSMGAAAMGLTTPRLFGHAVDQVVAELKAPDHAGFLQALMFTAALVIAASAMRGILTGLGGYQGEKVSQKVAYQLRLDFFQHLQKLPFGFHDKIHSGDLITRGMIDLEGARMFIQNGMLQSVTLVLLLFGASGLMIAEDWRMAALGLAFVPIAIFALGRMG